MASVNFSGSVNIGDDLNVSDKAFVGRLNVNRQALATTITAQQVADSNGFRLYGYDDKKTDYIEIYLNGNGAPSIDSNKNTIFFQTGVSVADDQIFGMGSGTDAYQFKYDDANALMRLYYSSSRNTNRAIMYVFDDLNVTRFVDDTNFSSNVNISGNLYVHGIVTGKHINIEYTCDI